MKNNEGTAFWDGEQPNHPHYFWRDKPEAGNVRVVVGTEAQVATIPTGHGGSQFDITDEHIEALKRGDVVVIYDGEYSTQIRYRADAKTED